MPDAKTDALKRIAIVGRSARYNRAVVDLDFPSQRARRALMIVDRDFDMDMLRGYDPEVLRYISMDASQYQRAFLSARGHTEISIEEAAAWLKAHA